MKSKSLLAIVISFSIFSSCETHTEQLTAPALIKKSAQYSGDISSQDLQLSIQIVVPKGKNRGQSYHPEPPYNSYRIETRFEIDRPKGKEIAQFINPFNGFVFGGFHVLDEGKYTAYDAISSTARAINTLGFEEYRNFPHIYLQRALQDTTLLAYEGTTTLSDAEAHIVKLQGIRETKFFIDTETYALIGVEQQTVHNPYGDGITQRRFFDYEKFSSLHLPTRIESGSIYESWGTLFNEYEVNVLENSISLPDINTYRPLAGDNPTIRMVSLAENIHMIQNIGNDKWGIFDYNVLVAEFEEHILVGEAPVSNAASRKAIEMIQNQFPDKPIQYMVQSHHHSDHIAGVREYLAKEVTIVVPTSTQDLINKIAVAPWILDPDNQAKDPKKPKFLAIDGPVTLNDDLNNAIIVNIGPIPHVNDMLAIYFPKQKLVWQADMITYGEWDLSIEPSVIFRDRIKEYGWEVNKIVGVHGQVLKGQALRNYLTE